MELQTQNIESKFYAKAFDENKAIFIKKESEIEQ